jgi:hypothetical protein
VKTRSNSKSEKNKLFTPFFDLLNCLFLNIPRIYYLSRIDHIIAPIFNNRKYLTYDIFFGDRTKVRKTVSNPAIIVIKTAIEVAIGYEIIIVAIIPPSASKKIQDGESLFKSLNIAENTIAPEYISGLTPPDNITVTNINAARIHTNFSKLNELSNSCIKAKFRNAWTCVPIGHGARSHNKLNVGVFDITMSSQGKKKKL